MSDIDEIISEIEEENSAYYYPKELEILDEQNRQKEMDKIYEEYLENELQRLKKPIKRSDRVVRLLEILNFNILKNKKDSVYAPILDNFVDYSTEFDDSLIKFVDEYFDKISYNNWLYGVLSFHYILGQIYKRFKIKKGGQILDLRTHIAYLKSSSGGKSAGATSVIKIIDNIKLEEVSPSLIAFNNKQKERHRESTGDIIFRNGEEVERHWRVIIEDEPSVNQNKYLRLNRMSGGTTSASLVGKIVTEDLGNRAEHLTIKTRVPGMLSKYRTDFLYYPEATVLFNKFASQYESSNLGYMLQVTESIHTGENKIQKNLVAGQLEIYPECSLLLTSIPTLDIGISVLQTGLFQRILLLYNDTSFTERMENADRDIDNLGEERESDKLFEQNKQFFTNKLLEKINFSSSQYDKTLGVIIINSEAKEYLKQYRKKFEDKVISDTLLNSMTREIYLSFFSRWLNHIYVMAAHRALFSNRVEINKYDVFYSSMIIDTCLDKLLIYIRKVYEESQKSRFSKGERLEDDIYNYLVNLFSSDFNLEFISVKEVIKYATSKFSLSQPRVYSALKQLEKDKKIFINKLKSSSYNEKVINRVGNGEENETF